jgi:hypothetical protein
MFRPMTEGWTVSVAREPSLFTYSGDEVVSFDYWVGADGARVRVQSWDVEREQNFYLGVPDVVAETWGHAELRLADFKPEIDPRRALEPGDRMLYLNFYGGRLGGKPFYVDNIRLRR